MRYFILLCLVCSCAQYGDLSQDLTTPNTDAEVCPVPPTTPVQECPVCETCTACLECPVCETCSECEDHENDENVCPDDGDYWRLICHLPPGNIDNKHTIKVGKSAVYAHFAHGDYWGPCVF